MKNSLPGFRYLFRTKYPILLVGLAVCLTHTSYSQLSADKRTVQYHDLVVRLEYKGNKTVLIIGLDNRTQVVDGSQENHFVGYIRATAGVPWKLKTQSGDPFIKDFTGSIAASMKAAGFNATALMATSDSDSKLKAVNNKGQSDYILLFKVNDWLSDQYDAGLVAHVRKLKYDIDLSVFDSENNLVLKKNLNEPSIDMSKKGYAQGDYKTFIPEAVRIELAKILNADDLINLLGGAPISENRLALVIGVKNYKNVAPLQNTLNDAMDMSATLKMKGFTVVEVYDPETKRQLQEGIVKYFQLLKNCKACTGMVFYSGHGMQVDGVNYLIPTGANPQLKADLDDQCVNMDYVMRAIEQAGNTLNIFILDACRNNPFRSFYRANEQGLSMVATPKGSYIVYSTKPGSVASDGTGRNGLFTSKLLKHINSTGLNIEQVFKLVASDVIAESKDTQRPWIASDFAGDFYFTPANGLQQGSSVQVSYTQPITNAKAEEPKRESAAAEADFGYDRGVVEEIKIGDQIWMSKNLNVDHYANGDKIDEVRINGEWEKAGKEGKAAWCFYNNNAEMAIDYGKLYNWYAVIDPRGLCPNGWRVPSDEDWAKLRGYLGDKPAEQLKSTSHWSKRPGTNALKFDAMPTGWRQPNGEFHGLRAITFFWASGKKGDKISIRRKVEKVDNRLERETDGNGQPFGQSVRCLKN